MSSSGGSSFGTGVATAGKVIADVRAVIFTVIGIAGLILGIYLLRKAKTNTWLSASFTVQTSNCPATAPPPGTICQVSGQYTLPNGTVISIPSVNIMQGTAQVGSTIAIEYNSQNPQEVRIGSGVTQSQERIFGYILIGISVLAIVISWLWAYAANRSRLVAQGTTVLEGASLLGRFI